MNNLHLYRALTSLGFAPWQGLPKPWDNSPNAVAARAIIAALREGGAR
jgi:hypothetical protein